ncbi:MAG: choice-of-anchor tandem repeat NxxGxxAF-containing protein [Candidatus Sericytochromatia bacterium]
MKRNSKPSQLVPIADTWQTFSEFNDFSPYAAAIDADGRVAFQAGLKNGFSGIFAGSGGAVDSLADCDTGPYSDYYSHPAIASGCCCFYAGLRSGGQGLFLLRQGQIIRLAETLSANSPFTRIGPLGPTINVSGMVAFRADSVQGTNGIYSAVEGRQITIAETGPRFRGFQGLPVINASGTVVFRADLCDGGQGIYIGSSAGLTPIAETGVHFCELGLFPSMDDAGAVVFKAGLTAGGEGIFAVSGGQLRSMIGTNDTDCGFAGFRGALIGPAGNSVCFATPMVGQHGGQHGGQLGVFSGPDPMHDRVLALGDELCESRVTDFALNHVSLNALGQMAIRVALANGRQLILRSDPRS